MNKAILLMLLLTACVSTGVKYTGNQKLGNITVYRPFEDRDGGNNITIRLNDRICNLALGNYYTIDSNAGIITASKWGNFGTASIDAKPGDFVKAEFKDTGWFNTDFILTKVPASLAKQQLSGLERMCQ